jgi:hypothetical protein
MVYLLLAAIVMSAHFALVLTVVLGGVLLFKWPRWSWVQMPLAAWGGFVLISNTTCPLTPLENWFRELGGQHGYTGGFLENYLLGWLSAGPLVLTRRAQIVMGLFVVAVNLALCLWAARHHARRPGAG